MKPKIILFLIFYTRMFLFLLFRTDLMSLEQPLVLMESFSVRTRDTLPSPSPLVGSMTVFVIVVTVLMNGTMVVNAR